MDEQQKNNMTYIRGMRYSLVSLTSGGFFLMLWLFTSDSFPSRTGSTNDIVTNPIQEIAGDFTPERQTWDNATAARSRESKGSYMKPKVEFNKDDSSAPKTVVTEETLQNDPLSPGGHLRQNVQGNGGNHDQRFQGNRQTSGDIKLILLWTSFYKSATWGLPIGSVFKNCPAGNCVVTTDKDRLFEAAAVLFCISEMPEAREFPKRGRPDQVFVFVWIEAPMYTPFTTLAKFNGLFNLTMTYRRDSDVTMPYGDIVPGTAEVARPSRESLRSKTSPVAWVISHCGKEHSRRNDYVRALQEHVPVDIYGKCGKPCPYTGEGCFSFLEKKYQFYIGFENSVCEEYVTEKFYRSLSYNMIPLVLGGGNYSRVLPAKAFINVMDYNSPAHVARYLKYLDGHPQEYAEYFAWRERFRVRRGSEMRMEAFCNLCRILHTPDYPFKVDFSVTDWWDREQHCLYGPDLQRRLNI